MVCVGEIGSYDVICGRHKESFNNIGNRRFRITIGLSLDRYLTAQTRVEKTLILGSIVEQVKNNGGHFLKWRVRQWKELSDKEAMVKVGHAIRNMAKAKGIGDKFQKNTDFLGKLYRCHPKRKDVSKPAIFKIPKTSTFGRKHERMTSSDVFVFDSFTSFEARNQTFIAEEFQW